MNDFLNSLSTQCDKCVKLMPMHHLVSDMTHDEPAWIPACITPVQFLKQLFWKSCRLLQLNTSPQILQHKLLFKDSLIFASGHTIKLRFTEQKILPVILIKPCSKDLDISYQTSFLYSVTSYFNITLSWLSFCFRKRTKKSWIPD